jgi:unsaturated rhamnogalacturonyl hydrolase
MIEKIRTKTKDGQALTYDKVPNFDDFGVGCFLLAGAEVYKIKY